MRKILATISDGHAGFVRGLCNPDVILFDEDPDGNEIPFRPQLSAFSRHLWYIQKMAIEYAKRLARDDEIIPFFKGDPTHGNHFYNELMSTSLANQIIMAKANIKPWLELDNVKCVRFAIGTDPHEYGEGSSTHLIIDGLKEYKKDIKAVNHGLATIADVTIDYAHHGPGPGIREWTRGGVARLYLLSLMQEDIKHGKTPPKLVLRGHVHYYKREWVEYGDYTSWLVILPSMSGISGYARKVTRSTPYITNGITLFEIVDGEIVKIHPLHVTKDMRRREIL